MKSNKKLFAILTLIAFMMTLAPMAAFGYSAAASSLKSANTSVGIYEDTDDLAKITVTFKNTDGSYPSSVDFVVTSDRDAEEGFVDVNENGIHDAGEPQLTSAGMAAANGQVILGVPTMNTASTPAPDGKVVIYVGSKVTGSFKFAVYNDAGITGSTNDIDDSTLIGSVTVSVSVGDGSVTLYANNEDDGTATGYDIDEGDSVMADAGDGVELMAYVHDGATDIEDATVTFQARYEGGSWYNIGTDVTDDDGEAIYYFEETKIGTYEYRAKYEDEKSGSITIEVLPLVTKTIELKTADGTKIAEDNDNNIDFYLKDKHGNLIKTIKDDAGTVIYDPWDPSDYQVKVESAPEGSKFEDLDWTSSVSGLATSEAKIGDGVLRLVFKPDKTGSYTLKVRDAAETRVTQTITVEAIEFDEAVSLAFVLNNATGEEVTQLARKYTAATSGTNEVDDIAGTLVVKVVNADGVKLDVPTIDITSDLKFASSNTSHVSIDVDGTIIVKKDASGTYDITVHYAPDNIVGVYSLKVVGGASALKATPDISGTSGTVTLQYIDKNGDNTFTNLTEEAFTVSVPSGVVASNVKKINKTGKGSFEVKADAPGTYNITVISDNKHIAATFPVTFGSAVKPVSKTITMFIGATGYIDGTTAKTTDVAPFIVDGRTFVAVRPVAEAFGAEIGWNEATQTVTLTTADATVTIVIGSSTITVVKGGVTSTITADVAAFIKDGRTVLPFRAVGEAFGAEVNYDAATQSVTYAF